MSLIRNSLKAGKLIIRIFQNGSKQGANQKVNQDRKLSTCERGKKKLKKLNFVVMPQFSLRRGLIKAPAFRYKSENLLQNERLAEEVFRTNL